jgi:esterase/lipase superfamily enzyme
VACVDSVDEESFYAKSRPPAERIRRHDQYDRYLYSEVVPYVRGRRAYQRAASERSVASSARTTPRTSAFRHPDVVDASSASRAKYDIHSFLDGYWDELCYFHCPTANVPNMDAEWVAKLSSMDIAIVTGETDNILSGTSTCCASSTRRAIRNRGSVWAAPVRPRLAVVEGADPQLRHVDRPAEQELGPVASGTCESIWTRC